MSPSLSVASTCFATGLDVFNRHLRFHRATQLVRRVIRKKDIRRQLSRPRRSLEDDLAQGLPTPGLGCPATNDDRSRLFGLPASVDCLLLPRDPCTAGFGFGSAPSFSTLIIDCLLLGRPHVNSAQLLRDLLVQRHTERRRSLKPTAQSRKTMG